jgi:tetratricopeptide (TPR) repeat protein
VRFAAVAPRLLLLAGAGCALVPAVPRTQLEGWSAVEAAEVRILGDLPADEMQRLADEIALFDAAFAHLASWSPRAGAVPVTVFAIRERELARRFGLGRGVAGWALLSLDGGFAAVEVGASAVATRSTLFHEYTHVLLRRNRRAPLPPWYDEGLASFFGTLGVRDGAVIVGMAPGATLAWVASRGPLPLEELFAGDIWGRSAKGVQDFYATSWALSHYLLLSPRGRREASRLVEALSRGVEPTEAERVAFGRSPEAIEAELRAHVAHLARGAPAEVLLDAEALGVREAGRPAPLSPADAACALGQLALRLATDASEAPFRPLARGLLERAAGAGTASARCEVALAEARALTGDGAGAERALARALARAPDDALVRLHAGRAELARAETADDAAAPLTAAEQQFRHALALDDRSASAWFGLGGSLERAGRADAALAALEAARRHGWSPDLDLALARLELARGNRERALALLWPLVQDPHGGRTREAASELLEQADLLPEAAPGSKTGANGGPAPRAAW